jgi:Acyl-protein synthetase, LuxE
MSIQQRVLAFIQHPEPAQFERLALEVFRWQFETVPAYSRHCLRLGVSPGAVRAIETVPLVSTIAFKFADLAPPNAAARPGAATFLTSGSTQGRERRGRHVIADAEIYRASAMTHMRRMLFPEGKKLRMLALHPTADADSSLGAMIGWCIAEFGTGAGEALCATDPGGIDLDGAIGFLEGAELDGKAVCILGTTAAFGALFGALDQRGRRLRLPAGSRMMDTGGAKGQVVALDAAEVARLAASLLAIAPELVVNEYGMTELCSQLYDATAFNSDHGAPPGMRVKIAPPWMRAAAIDPVTLKPRDNGAPGLLAFFDLANVDSVSAVLTEDIGIVASHGVRLLGRAGAADVRGCALAIESFAAAGASAAG